MYSNNTIVNYVNHNPYLWISILTSCLLMFVVVVMMLIVLLKQQQRQEQEAVQRFQPMYSRMINEPINQSINQPELVRTNQSINRPIYQQTIKPTVVYL